MVRQRSFAREVENRVRHVSRSIARGRSRAMDAWRRQMLRHPSGVLGPEGPAIFISEDVAAPGLRWSGTGATAPTFSYLWEIRAAGMGLVDQNSASWNRMAVWLRRIDGIRLAA